MIISLLQKLIKRGDKVYVADGVLNVEPRSGKSVPPNWLKQNHDELVAEIVKATGMVCFKYIGYSTGNYGKGNFPGVYLQFESIHDLSTVHCIFNAITRRQRGKDAGKALPKGKFSVKKHSAFVKFWRKTKLPIPTRLSAFHDYMGNLKRILFTMQLSKDGKPDKNSIEPINIPHEQIQSYLGLGMPCNFQTSTRQPTNNNQTMLANSNVDAVHITQDIQEKHSTCYENYDSSNQDSAGQDTVNSKYNYKTRPEEQTVEEWFAEYDAYNTCDRLTE